ncbi:unnamed protein product [Arctogadus glacialis]
MMRQYRLRAANKLFCIVIYVSNVCVFSLFAFSFSRYVQCWPRVRPWENFSGYVGQEFCIPIALTVYFFPRVTVAGLYCFYSNTQYEYTVPHLRGLRKLRGVLQEMD